MKMGQKLKKLRIDEGLTQEELAANLKISRSALSMYELDIRQIPHETVLAITRYFQVSLDYMYGLED